MEAITVYKTADGQVWKSVAEATAHEVKTRLFGGFDKALSSFVATYTYADKLQLKEIITEWEVHYRKACLDSEISRAEFPARTYSVLKAAEINTLSDLCSYSQQRLLKVPNLGRKSLGEIVSILSFYRLSLAPL